MCNRLQQGGDTMNLPPTYRHDDGYEPPRPARVYDIPQIVERRPVLGRLRTVLLPMGQRLFASSSRRQSAQPTIEKPRRSGMLT
jgi:hypothetical protein